MLRVLGWFQSQAGANPAWNPRREDTYRQIVEKLVHVVRGD